MNAAQQEDLFIELGLCDDITRKEMGNVYQQLWKLQNSEDSFLDFLKQKLEIEGYWKKVGLV